MDNLRWLPPHSADPLPDFGFGMVVSLFMEPDFKRAFGELKAFVDGFSLAEEAVKKVGADTQAGKLLKQN